MSLKVIPKYATYPFWKVTLLFGEHSHVIIIFVFLFSLRDNWQPPQAHSAKQQSWIELSLRRAAASD